MTTSQPRLSPVPSGAPVTTSRLWPALAVRELPFIPCSTLREGLNNELAEFADAAEVSGWFGSSAGSGGTGRGGRGVDKPVPRLGEQLSWGRSGRARGGHGQRLLTIAHLPSLCGSLFLSWGAPSRARRSRLFVPRGVAAGEPSGTVEHTEEGNLCPFLGLSVRGDTQRNSLPQGVCSGPSRF